MNNPYFSLRHINSITWIVLLAVLSLASCGGGGDGGDVVDTPATIPDVLNHEIKQADDTDLVIVQSESSVTITSALLTGTFDRTNDDFTLVPFGPAMVVNAASFLDGLYEKMRIPRNLAQLNIKRSDFKSMAEAALKIERLLKNNVRHVSFDDAVSIYEQAYSS